MKSHAHQHGVLDPSITSTARGLWAVKWSFIGLLVTAMLQATVVAVSGSVALLADTIHNLGDAATALPLGLAFWLARREASRRFSYGLGRVEDFAGLAIVLTIFASAATAMYESITRFMYPHPLAHLWAVVAAAGVGFLGNEAAALVRIRVGRQIGSAALVADGHHARVDGWISLSVLIGALGVWAGYPIADPIVGLLISLAISVLVWQSARAIGTRMLDGVETGVLEAIEHAAHHVPGVDNVTDVRARWVGHHLQADVSITVASTLSVGQGHEIAKEARHQIAHHVANVGSVMVHVDPANESGDVHHGVGVHSHDGLPPHGHD